MITSDDLIDILNEADKPDDKVDDYILNIIIPIIKQQKRSARSARTVNIECDKIPVHRDHFINQMKIRGFDIKVVSININNINSTIVNYIDYYNIKYYTDPEELK